MLRLHLLGHPALHGPDGDRLPGIFRSSRRLALLAYLVDGQGTSSYQRAHLVSMFWPDLMEEPGRRALRNALYGLRQDLGPGVLIPAGSDGLAVAADRIESDSMRFESHLRGGELRQAVELYRGPFLEGFEPIDLSPDYYHWVDGRRAALQQLALAAVDRLVSSSLESDRLEEALAWRRVHLRIDPVDESAHRQAMEILDLMGDRAGALALFEGLQRRLRAQLDIEPAPETIALATGLRSRAEPAERPRSSSPLEAFSCPPPSPPTVLIGREQEIGHVQRLLADRHRLITITGAGGSGKTRLAMAVARREWDRFRGGTAYVELAAVRDPDEAIPTIARAVGIKESEERTLAEGLAAVIGERRVLLVVDNFEQVIEASDQVAGLLTTCPHLTLLVTSRAPLRIRGEMEYPLRPLEAPPSGFQGADPEELARYPAARLFMERAREVVHDFAPDAGDRLAIAGICRRLDGLPLALELAALRLRSFDPPSLLSKLGNALDFLTLGPRDLPDRQRTLRATIDWSHALLLDSERRLFRRLAVFANGASREAAEEICVFGADDAERFPTDLESLVEKGLVEAVGREPRIGFLETIREFSEERLGESGELARLQDAHARYYAAFAERVDREFRAPGQVSWVRKAELEEPNLEAALSWLADVAASGDLEAADRAMRICGHLWFHWHVRGKHVSTRRWSRLFLGLPGANRPTPARALALRAAGLASWTLGDFGAAVAELDEAAAIARGCAPRLLPGILFVVGVAHLSAGELESARDRLGESSTLSREMAEPWELGMALVLTGLMEAAVGEAEPARRHFLEALRIQQENGDEEGAGLSLGGLAALEAAGSNYGAAIEFYQASLRAFEAVGDRPEEARILAGWAWSALASKRPDEARELFARSLRAYEDVGSTRGVGLALLGLAATEVEQGRPERAIELAAAAEVFREQEGMVNDYAEGSPAPEYLARARSAIPRPAIARHEALGRARTVAEAVRYALEPRAQPPAGVDGEV